MHALSICPIVGCQQAIRDGKFTIIVYTDAWQGVSFCCVIHPETGVTIASSPGHPQILSSSCGEKPGIGNGIFTRHHPCSTFSTYNVQYTWNLSTKAIIGNQHHFQMHPTSRWQAPDQEAAVQPTANLSPCVRSSFFYLYSQTVICVLFDCTVKQQYVYCLTSFPLFIIYFLSIAPSVGVFNYNYNHNLSFSTNGKGSM